MKNIFNRRQLSVNQKRFSKNFADYNFIHQKIASSMLENIDLLGKKDFTKVLDLGVMGSSFFQDLAQDIMVTTSLFDNKECDMICDDELLPFEKDSFDLVLSNLNMQFINEIPQFLLQVKEILKPQGVFMASFFAEENLKELNHAMQLSEDEIYGRVSPRMPPTIDVKTAAMLLQKCGFKNAVSNLEKIEVSYQDPMNLLKDIKNMALGNILNQKSSVFFTKKLLERLLENYRKLYQDKDGAVKATFEIVIISGQK